MGNSWRANNGVCTEIYEMCGRINDREVLMGQREFQEGGEK